VSWTLRAGSPSIWQVSGTLRAGSLSTLQVSWTLRAGRPSTWQVSGHFALAVPRLGKCLDTSRWQSLDFASVLDTSRWQSLDFASVLDTSRWPSLDLASVWTLRTDDEAATTQRHIPGDSNLQTPVMQLSQRVPAV
jgi:hypothetical protein